MYPLRSDYLVALNAAVASLEEAANLYETAAQQCDGRDSPLPFAALSGRRKAMAATLKGMVRDQDDVPSTPPSEQLILQAVAARLKTLWADNVIDAFLSDICACERAAADRLAQAAALAAERAAAQRLCAFGDEIGRLAERLAGAGA